MHINSYIHAYRDTLMLANTHTHTQSTRECTVCGDCKRNRLVILAGGGK